MKEQKKEGIYVMCNKKMLDFIKPMEYSKPIKLTNRREDVYFIAKYQNLDILEEKTDKEYYESGAMRRHSGGSIITSEIKDKFDMEYLKKVGLLDYILEKHNVSNDKHLECIFRDMAWLHGKDLIEFANSIS